MTLSFSKVSDDNHINTVSHLAHTIWPEHYTPIIGNEQVDYMLRTFHSRDAIGDEIAHRGYLYYLIEQDETPIGYIGIKLEAKALFLSKLYLLSEARGKGIGWQAIGFICDIAQSHQLKKITLTVNRNNTGSITAYKKMGFRILGEVCAEIGEGYVMDDYQMALTV